MKQGRLLTLLPTIAALTAGCGDSTGVEVNDLAGTWEATAYVFTSVADPTQMVDIIAAGGSYSLTIAVDSSFTTRFLEPGETMETKTGSVTVLGSTLTIAKSGQGSPTDFSAVRDGNAMTLITQDEDYDFDGDQVEDEATLRVELTRQ